MRRIILTIIATLLLTPSFTAKADEGMWMVNMLEKGLVSKMKKAGLKLPANVIYDESAVSIKDAVVSLDFGCTGSMVSEEGLMITNHHCAYSDVHSISTNEHNYLEDGFWAMSREQEVHIKGKGAWFLRKVIDVTDEVAELQKEKKMNLRKLSYVMEKKYAEETGYEASLASMWRGEKYYMYLYEVYRDLRLVAAPPVSIAAYGGDTDNWEWPQHKGDFAIYRIYTAPDGSPAEYSEENVPMKPRKTLKISTKGVKTGDYTMILGYPGSTNRYNSSFGVNKKEKLTNPITTKVRGDKLAIMDKWMSIDPAVRLLYADKYFSVSNAQEFWSGEVISFRRYGVTDIRKGDEKELQAWIQSSPERIDKWGDLLDEMAETYSEVEEIERDMLYFRETLISSNPFYGLSTRLKGMFKKGVDSIYPAQDKIYMSNLQRTVSSIDFRVEKELLYYGFRTYTENVESSKWGERVNKLMDKFGHNPEAVMDYVWNTSIFTDVERLMAAMEGSITRAEVDADPIYDLLHSLSFGDLNAQKNKIMEHGRSGKGKKHGRGRQINALEKEYTHAMYEMRLDKGQVQYPDANSTMRLTYGTVGPIHPFDGVYYSEISTAHGILEKYNPDDYEFTLKEKQLGLVKANPTLPVNFLSNNDITGGNSGSPVLNAKGELIGLAFDGNKESLCSDAYFHPDYCKTVSVDIRYVLWVLKYYAEADHILEELEF